MTTPTCEAAISADVLEAARVAADKHIAHFSRRWAPEAASMSRLSEKQRPLVPLLMALLDAAEAVARAVEDNAWDDGAPVDRAMAEGLANQAYRLGAVVTNASSAHDANSWSLPSMSGKELV